MTADRIAELKATIAELEQADAPAHMADAARAELSRLRNPELNSRGEPMDHATIARGRKPPDVEPWCEHSNCPPDECDVCSSSAPSPATSPGPSDVWKALNAAIDFIAGEYRDPALEAQGEWLPAKARKVHAKLVAALAQSDAQPSDAKLYTTPPSLPEGAREALEKAANILHVALYGHGYIGGITGSDNWRDCVKITERIAAALATPTPSSAGLIEAAEIVEKMQITIGGVPYGVPMINHQSVFKIIADDLRARAADRSAT